MGKFFGKLFKIVGIAMMVLVPGFGAIWGTIASAFLVGGSVLDARAQQKDAKRRAARALSDAQAQTISIRRAIVPRRIVYGRARIGGIWAYVDNSENNKYLYLVLALSDGPNKAVPEIYFDDQLVTLDGDAHGTTLNGTEKWNKNRVRIKKFLGTSNQPADSDLVNDSTEWTSAHQLKGMGYLSIRLKHDPKVFPNGLPNVSAVVEGRSDIVDSRDDPALAKYTTNPVWCLAHYLTQSTIGPNVDWDTEIDHESFKAAADICDELVDLEATDVFSVQYSNDANEIIPDTQPHGLFNSQIVEFTTDGALPAGLNTGTDYYVVNATRDTFEVSLTLDGSPVALSNNGTGQHTFTAKEHRYTFNGIVNLDQSPEEIMRLFSDSFAGVVCYIGGKWTVYAGAYQIPSFTINEDILSGPISFRPRRSKRDRYNTVKGFFMSHQTRWNPSDYPPVANSSYEANDGEELIQGLDLPVTATPQMAQRLAKIVLEQGRMERALQLKCNLEALRAQAGRTVIVDLPRYHINNQAYNVNAWALTPSADKGLEISLTLTEESINNYNWASGNDEQPWIPTAEPVLFDGSITEPQDFDKVNVSQGRQLVGVELTWTQSTDEFILTGGSVIVQWKKTSASEYEESVILAGDSTKYLVAELEASTAYDFQVAFRNVKNGQSDWSEILNHTTIASSSSAYAYSHLQSTPSTVWTITHRLGYRPGSVWVEKDDGTVVRGLPSRGSPSDPSGETEIQITFNSAISGIAFLS